MYQGAWVKAAEQTGTNTMSKEIKERVQKPAKTIKVTTVAISVAVTVAIVGAFIGGYFFKASDDSRVTQEAAQLVSTLKIDAK